jgi:diketogulonate reductase-like aldo/keto reductase
MPMIHVFGVGEKMTKNITNQTYRLASGREMPVLGLGTWQLFGAACERIARAAIDLGYRHIDTAELYENETEIGRAIRGFDRGSLFITSKVSSEHLRANDVILACTGSLSRLATDYLDLFLLHWPNDEIPLEETMDGMQYLVEEGLVRSIGVSNFDVGRMERVMAASEAPLCNNQVEYHPYRHRRAIPEFCREHSSALTAYCPLAKGRVLKDPILARIGRRRGKSAAQVSLRWLLQKGAVIIPKASSIEHLQANRAMDGWELSEDDMRQIDAIDVEARLVDSTYT